MSRPSEREQMEAESNNVDNTHHEPTVCHTLCLLCAVHCAYCVPRTVPSGSHLTLTT